jgi:hypothetical protein
LDILFNIILQFTPRSFKWYLYLSGLPNKISMYLVCLSYVPHAPPICSWFDRLNNTSIWWRIRSIKASCYVVFSITILPLSFQAQISFSVPCSRTPSAYVTPSVWETKFHTHAKQ